MTHQLVIVSTRLPVNVKKIDGKLEFHPSDGGLASALSSIDYENSIWIGWPGIAKEDLTPSERHEITKKLAGMRCYPVFLNREQVKNYYLGYCNSTIWPMFHYFASQAEFKQEYWHAYNVVSKMFTDEIQKISSKDSNIWIHDYHLMLVPKMLREINREANIGFFLHTPFPSFEIFRLMPERDTLLRSMLGADLIGFHTYDYVRHFFSSVQRALGYDNLLGMINYDNRHIKVDAFPIGIDYKKFSSPVDEKCKEHVIKNLKLKDKKCQIVLSVDRMDYSKGMLARLSAIEYFLTNYPKYLKKVKFVMIAVPSRAGIEAYDELRRKTERKVHDINKKFSISSWSPITYKHSTSPMNEVKALYSTADVMLVTPIRDGMNLVAKEYVATKQNGGVLILSDMAGAAKELVEALIVNPNDHRLVSVAIKRGLEMSKSEQKLRMNLMKDRVSMNTVHKWLKEFIFELEKIRKGVKVSKKIISDDIRKQLLSDYKNSNKRLLLLDYDGTLKDFVLSPDEKFARPSNEVKAILRRLTADNNNRVIIVSGRTKKAMEYFFDDDKLGLIAEHGGWEYKDGKWEQAALGSLEWKKKARPILERYLNRTPGAIIEEKDFSLVWHYRRTEPDLAYVRVEEIKMELEGELDLNDVGLFDGQKILEIKPRRMHKGALVKGIADRKLWDFILCIGDDYTDEDMFQALPKSAYTIHVGQEQTAARYQLDDVDSVVHLIDDLSNSR